MTGRLIGPGSLLQGTVPGGGLASGLFVRRLEAVVLDAAGVPSALVHYQRDQRRPDASWVRAETICSDAVGPGVLAQAPGTWRRPGDLHVLVPVAGADGPELAHLTRPGSPAEASWTRVGTARDASDWPGWRADWRGRRADGEGGSGLPRGLPADCVAVAVADTAIGSLPILSEVLAGLPGGDRGLVGPARLPGGRGWRQALVQEGASLYLWHRQEWRGRVRWVRASCMRFDPGDGIAVEPAPSVKLAQVTGEVDTQPSSSGRTLSTSRSRSGVRGTDLGVRFDHDGRGYLLFGDTHWTRVGRATLDSIGAIRPAGGPGLPEIELHGAPIRARGDRASRREYDVPLDAFSFDGGLYGFFASNHFVRQQVMGRSVLARARDPRLRISGRERRRPIDFDVAGTFSDRHFINVSVQRTGDLLYVWGSGAYRAGDLRLAAFDLTAPALRDALAGRVPWSRPFPGVTYWAGVDADGAQRWASDEDAAAPVLRAALGELSVRWVPEASRYVLLAMSGPEDPIGPAVTLRSAPAPWGPWSARRRLFDWHASGVCAADEASRFIRSRLVGDPVGDEVFSVQARMTGGAYAPYLFDSRREGEAIVLRYTLSTWNPYQVVLMEHRLDAASLA